MTSDTSATAGKRVRDDFEALLIRDPFRSGDLIILQLRRTSRITTRAAMVRIRRPPGFHSIRMCRLGCLQRDELMIYCFR